MTMEDILRMAQEAGSSDIHLCPGSPLEFRINGELIPQTPEPLTPEFVTEVMRPVVTDEQLEQLEELGEIDFAFSLSGFSRVRANLFQERNIYAAALRILSSQVPQPQQLGIPQAIVNLTNRKRGLVLVTGATGSGKSTTLASLIRVISERDSKNIITLEDPIEYIHPFRKSVVSQREVGVDTKSYASGLRAALRQDPDVILVGEMRDLETISTAISAAETGHLVFSTLHTNSAADAVDRVIDVFPPHQQQQIRIQFSGVLEGIIAQQLLPRVDGHGRFAAFEVMLANPAIRNLVREGKAYQIPSIMQTSRKEGMQMMDDAIMGAFQNRLITKKIAVTFAHDQIAMENKLRMYQ